MTQESHKGNTALIVIAVIGVLGTVIATSLGIFGEYTIEKLHQETELTRIALEGTTPQINVIQTELPTQAPTDKPVPSTEFVFPPTLIAPSAVPTDVPTPTVPIKLITSQLIEAENGELSDAAYTVNDITAQAASNNAYVNLGSSSTIKFVIPDLTGGQYELLIRYAKYVNDTPAFSEPDHQNLYINNNPNPVLINYFKTFGDEDQFVKWQDSSVFILLEQGTNILVIKNNVAGFHGAVGIDRIFIRLIN